MARGGADVFFAYMVFIFIAAVMSMHSISGYKDQLMDLRQEYAVTIVDMEQVNSTCRAVFRVDKTGLGYQDAVSIRVYLIEVKKDSMKQVFKPAYGDFAVVNDVDTIEMVAGGDCIYYPQQLDVKAEAQYKGGEVVPIFFPIVIPMR